MTTTTLLLDDELVAKVERLRQDLGLSFEEFLQLDTARSPTVPVALGGCLIDDFDDTSKALGIAEGEAFR